MEITLIKTLRGLTPAYESDLEKHRKIPLNTPLVFKVSIARNLKFHKKFFALIKLVFENQDFTNDMEILRKAILIKAGFSKEYPSLDGELLIDSKSISFANMDETEFSEVYDKCLNVIISHFKFDKESISREIERFY